MRGLLLLAGCFALACGGESSDETGNSGGSTSDASTGGTGALGGSGATGGSGGTAGAGATGGAAGAGATGACNAENCQFTCCGDACVNTDNDIKNCGSCGNVCGESASPFCDAGTCAPAPPCDGPLCGPAGTCCGTSCCQPGELCCDVPGPVETGITCVTPINGTCPPGCKDCKCNAPDTAIATPSGERAIADLRAGDLVYSVHQNAVVAVPITRVQSVDAPKHRVVELELDNGRFLHVSAAHPTADGRNVGQLAAGDRIDGVAVVSSTLVPLREQKTFDILPASDTGIYFAAGVSLKSTLAGR